MLAAMSDRSFVVVYAYIKTEPVQVALFGLVFLGDVVTLPMGAAILIATTGVVLMSLKPGTKLDVRATLLGIAAGGMFALSAVGYRGAILSLGLQSYLMAATFTLVVGLIIQCALLSAWSVAARAQGAAARLRGNGGRRCSPASSARSPRSSGFSPLRSPPPRACARWRWSRCCSRRRSRRSCSSRRRPREKPSASC